MSLIYKAIIFVVISTGNVLLSRASLFKVLSHGFYRFFAFESVLLLILLNLDYWFYRPFSSTQIISWVLLILCLIPLIFGVLSLYRRGKPSATRKDPTLMSIEKTTQLVTVGIYRYIRHPIYSALFIGVWGVFFKHPSWAGFGLAIIADVFITLTARMEETENLEYFGFAYREYMKRTRKFIPFIF